MKNLIANPSIVLSLSTLAAGESVAQKPDKGKPANNAVAVRH